MRGPSNFSKVALVAMLCLASQASAQQAADWIVAIVNDEAIPNSRLVTEVDSARAQLRASGQPAPQREQMRKIILPSLVQHALQLQRARLLVGTVAPAMIDATLRDILAANGNMTLAEFARVSGRTVGGLRARIGEELAINEALRIDSLQDQEIDGAKLDEALRTRLRNEDRREYLVEHVHLPLANLELARKFQALGEDFAPRASGVTLSEEEVRLGWRLPSRMPEAFATAIKQLRPGETTEVLELPNGLHVLRLVAIRPMVPGQSRRMVRVKLLTVGAEQGELLEQGRALIINGDSSFSEQAELLSGAITYLELPADELPGPLARKQRLRVGEVAGPYAVGAGFQLALLVELREELIGDERLRQEMRVVLTNDNVERLRRKWLANLRSVATIEYLRDTV